MPIRIADFHDARRRDRAITDYVHRVDDDEKRRIRRFGYIAAATTVLFVVVVIIGIATAHLWIRAVSHESERRFAEPHVGWVREYLLDDADPALQSYVEALGNDIAAAMPLPEDLQLEFHVVDGDSANAFTTLGGHIFVLDQLLVELDSENSLAMVLAHEIGHAINRDPLTATGRGVLLQLMISALSGGGMDPSTSAGVGADLTLNAYSRRQEEAADRLALEALDAHYGHVAGATRLFEILGEENVGVEVPEILSSHPDIGRRIEAIEQRIDAGEMTTGTAVPYPDEIQEALSPRL